MKRVAVFSLAAFLSMAGTTMVNGAGDRHAGVAYAQDEGDGDNNQAGVDEPDGDNNQSGTNEPDGDNNPCENGIDPITGLPCL